MDITTTVNRFQPYVLGLLRIVVGYLFVIHGTTKLFQIPAIEMFANVPIGSIFWIAGLLELVLGILLILGLFTRLAAFLASGEMAFAYFIGHVSQAPSTVFMPILNSGELAVTWCFVFLYLAVAGAGAFALDHRLAARKVH
ncbi:putative oxidoreductase [Thiothrix eikelboomii]|uniref:Putative oxidoreductase n=1 Tax=Thiothrix eikelboomii TaxID=92487 RepID=A0A1T4WR69_9GAMM|nr:DoxX family protein [Thiothrix eikelboomii]SKA79358.1 putative oxidoreductase [Thiothrix eikelboomii]